MALQRKTVLTPIAPTNNSPLPPLAVKLRTQTANTSFPTGGMHTVGNIRFSLNSAVLVGLATQAFKEHSEFKDDAKALEVFLRALDITSAFEGGFDSINTYDKAGVSLGFLQFARPAAGAGRLLELAGRPDLATLIRTRFGTKDPHNGTSAVAARKDAALLTSLIEAVSAPQGIKAQLAMAINMNTDNQHYFDMAYARAKAIKVLDPMCAAMLFDGSINMGCGCLSRFSAPTAGHSDGDWLKASASQFSRPERKTGWDNMISTHFA